MFVGGDNVVGNSFVLCFLFQIVDTVGWSARGPGCNYLHGSDNCGGVPPTVLFVHAHILLQISQVFLQYTKLVFLGIQVADKFILR